MTAEGFHEHKPLRSIAQVAFGNIVKVLSGVMAGFLLPRLLAVTEYSLYKTCTLYAVYVGLLSAGLVDGIALRWAGQDAGAVDKPSFRCAARIYLMIEAGFSLVGIAVSFLLPQPARNVLIYLSVFLLANNITAFFQTLAQCVGHFSAIARLNILQSLLTILCVAALWLPQCFGRAPTAALFLVISTCAGLIVTAVWAVRYRTFIFGKASGIRHERAALHRLFTTGTPLMVANLCSLLMLSVDRQFVNIHCDAGVYAGYAFAYNVVTMLSMTIAALTTVLYPLLKRTDANALKENLFPLAAAVVLLVSVCLLLYAPLTLFIQWFLPAYSNSIPILRIILPGLLLSSVTTIVLQSYYMALGMTLRFCLQGLAMLAVSFLADLTAWHCFGTPEALSAASVITLMLWCVVTFLPLCKHFAIRSFRVPAAMVLSLAGFYTITQFSSWLAAFGLELLLLIPVTLLLWPNLHKIGIKKGSSRKVGGY